jgi:replicative DNA helicase
MNVDENLHLRDLEQCVVGAVLIDAGTLDVMPALEPEDFHDLRARACWAAVRALQAAGRPVDEATLEAQLASDDCLEAVGVAYLGACAMRVPTAANAIEYAQRVRDAALARKVRLDLADVLERIQRDRMTGAEALTEALASMTKLDCEQPDEARAIGELVRIRCGQLEKLAEQRESGAVTMTGFPTGVAELDRVTGGVQPGIVTIVAARPGMGKSSLGLAIADGSSTAGVGVHVFSLEDTMAAYTDRSMSRESGVPAEDMRAMRLNRKQMADLSQAVGRLRFQRRGWIVDDRSGITAEEVVRSVRRHRRQNGTRVVIVDYIQLLRWPRDCRSAHDALTASITTLADAAKQDGMAYVVMSQLNRSVEQRADKRPLLSDLRESGSLEERAKCVVGIYRGSYYGGAPKRGVDFQCSCKGPEEGDAHAPSQEAWERMAILLLLKNSNGATGEVVASWNAATTTME